MTGVPLLRAIEPGQHFSVLYSLTDPIFRPRRGWPLANPGYGGMDRWPGDNPRLRDSKSWTLISSWHFLGGRLLQGRYLVTSCRCQYSVLIYSVAHGPSQVFPRIQLIYPTPSNSGQTAFIYQLFDLPGERHRLISDKQHPAMFLTPMASCSFNPAGTEYFLAVSSTK